MENREVKFRAWDIDSSEMVYANERSGQSGFYFDFKGNSFCLMMPVEDDYPEKRDAVLMQYTGYNIHQTNDKPVEVWEHDICYSDLWNKNVLIEFKDGMFGVDSEDGFMPIISCRLVKKVGNKHENSELL